MAYSYINYEGTGETVNYSVPFPYAEKPHVLVYVEGILKTVTTDYTWLNDSVVQFNTAPILGTIISLVRSSGRDARLVDFQTSSLLDEATLDLNSNQLFYLMQEAFDALVRASGEDSAIFTTPESIVDAMQDSISFEHLADDLTGSLGYLFFNYNTDAIYEFDDAGEEVYEEGVMGHGTQRHVLNEFIAAALDTRITTAEIDINAAEGTILLHASAITDLETSEGDHETRIGVVEIDLDAAEATIVLHAASIVTSDSDIDDLETLTGTHTTQIGVVEIDLDAAEATIVLHAASITQAESDIGGIDTWITQATIDIDAAEAQVAINVTDISTIDGTVDAHAATLVLMADEFFVKLDNNGNVAGFGLINDETSAFIVNADEFAVIKADGTGDPIIPFAIDVGSGLIRIDGTLLVSGSVDTDHLAADAITADKIEAGAITAAAINGADMGTLTITSGAIVISVTEGIEISGGADLTLEGSDTDPGKVIFKGTEFSVEMGGNADGSEFTIAPNTTDGVSFIIGNPTFWHADKYWQEIQLFASHDVKSEVGLLATMDGAESTASAGVDVYSNSSGTNKVLIHCHKTGTKRSIGFYFNTGEDATLKPTTDINIDLGMHELAYRDAYVKNLIGGNIMLPWHMLDTETPYDTTASSGSWTDHETAPVHQIYVRANDGSITLRVRMARTTSGSNHCWLRFVVDSAISTYAESTNNTWEWWDLVCDVSGVAEGWYDMHFEYYTEGGHQCRIQGYNFLYSVNEAT